MSGLSDNDTLTILRLRDQNVLKEVGPHLIDQSQGAILVSCADGDQIPDIFTYHAEMQNGHRKDPRIHMFGWNGGALRLAPDSPANKVGHTTQLDLLQDIGDALHMKQMSVVALYVHAPCGKAKASGISVYDTVRLLFAAKDTVKIAFPDIKVACFCHVDFGPNFERFGKKRRKLTYFASRDAFHSHPEQPITMAGAF
jgi:hypothetical protein